MTIFHDTKDDLRVDNITLLNDLRVADTSALVKVLATEHRTNQQLLARNIFAILKHWSDDYEKGNYDARNEATVKLANEMVSGSELSQGKIYLPYI